MTLGTRHIWYQVRAYRVLKTIAAASFLARLLQIRHRDTVYTLVSEPILQWSVYFLLAAESMPIRPGASKRQTNRRVTAVKSDYREE